MEKKESSGSRSSSKSRRMFLYVFTLILLFIVLVLSVMTECKDQKKIREEDRPIITDVILDYKGINT